MVEIYGDRMDGRDIMAGVKLFEVTPNYVHLTIHIFFIQNFKRMKKEKKIYTFLGTGTSVGLFLPLFILAMDGYPS